jgi:hypothetical protein
MDFYKYLLRKFGVSKKSVYIVSGLPRSGTSMMMKMLEAGGIPAFIDNIRVPDEDNPKGYYEYERVKQLAKDSAWISEACGKAVKIISMLLVHLPPGFEYKIIFMQRNMNEILASQAAMLENSGKNAGISDEDLSVKFSKHLEQIKKWLEHQPNIKTLFVNYNSLLQSPSEHIKKINGFTAYKLREDKMLEIIDPSLYRQRK